MTDVTSSTQGSVQYESIGTAPLALAPSTVSVAVSPFRAAWFEYL